MVCSARLSDMLGAPTMCLRNERNGLLHFRQLPVPIVIIDGRVVTCSMCRCNLSRTCRTCIRIDGRCTRTAALCVIVCV